MSSETNIFFFLFFIFIALCLFSILAIIIHLCYKEQEIKINEERIELNRKYKTDISINQEV